MVDGPADGAGGIRTLDRGLKPYNGLANRRLQPLGHHSRNRKRLRASSIVTGGTMRYQREKGEGALEKGFTWLSASVVAAGIALRRWQYLGRRALWSDEAAVASNMVSRG